MAYDNNTITNADGAGQLIAAIEAMMTTHTNWDAVEQGISLSSELHYVWKCNGAGNDFGTDFYVMMTRQSATVVRFTAFEAYTPASGTPANARLIRPVMNENSGSRVPNSDGSFGPAGGVALSTTTATSVAYVQLSVNTTGYEYFITLSNNYLRVGCRVGTSDGAIEAGIFNTLLPGGSGPSESFPLFISHVGSGAVNTSNYTSSSGNLACSRHPNLPDTTSRASIFGHLYDVATLGGPQIGGPTSTSYDRYQGPSGTILYAVPGITTLSSALASTIGYARGRPRDLVVTAVNVSGSRIGDEYTIGSDVYLAWYYAGTQKCWIKKSVT